MTSNEQKVQPPTEHLDLIVGGFNEDSLNEGSITILLKSLGFNQIISDPTHTHLFLKRFGDCIFTIYFTSYRYYGFISLFKFIFN